MLIIASCRQGCNSKLKFCRLWDINIALWRRDKKPGIQIHCTECRDLQYIEFNTHFSEKPRVNLLEEGSEGGFISQMNRHATCVDGLYWNWRHAAWRFRKFSRPHLPRRTWSTSSSYFLKQPEPLLVYSILTIIRITLWYQAVNKSLS